MTGTIIRVIDDRFFGFIKPDTTDSPDVFFHGTALAEHLQFGKELLGVRVAYELIDSAKGACACNVRDIP